MASPKEYEKDLMMANMEQYAVTGTEDVIQKMFENTAYPSVVLKKHDSFSREWIRDAINFLEVYPGHEIRKSYSIITKDVLDVYGKEFIYGSLNAMDAGIGIRKPDVNGEYELYLYIKGYDILTGKKVLEISSPDLKHELEIPGTVARWKDDIDAFIAEYAQNGLIVSEDIDMVMNRLKDEVAEYEGNSLTGTDDQLVDTEDEEKIVGIISPMTNTRAAISRMAEDARNSFSTFGYSKKYYPLYGGCFKRDRFGNISLTKKKNYVEVKIDPKLQNAEVIFKARGENKKPIDISVKGSPLMVWYNPTISGIMDAYMEQYAPLGIENESRIEYGLYSYRLANYFAYGTPKGRNLAQPELQPEFLSVLSKELQKQLPEEIRNALKITSDGNQLRMSLPDSKENTRIPFPESGKGEVFTWHGSIEDEGYIKEGTMEYLFRECIVGRIDLATCASRVLDMEQVENIEASLFRALYNLDACRPYLFPVQTDKPNEHSWISYRDTDGQVYEIRICPFNDLHDYFMVTDDIAEDWVCQTRGREEKTKQALEDDLIQCALENAYTQEGRIAEKRIVQLDSPESVANIPNNKTQVVAEYTELEDHATYVVYEDEYNEDKEHEEYQYKGPSEDTRKELSQKMPEGYLLVPTCVVLAIAVSKNAIDEDRVSKIREFVRKTQENNINVYGKRYRLPGILKVDPKTLTMEKEDGTIVRPVADTIRRSISEPAKKI